jgi:MinD superfamily P-loop ATPase
MPFIVSVSGGKGGTGKSFVATNLAALLSAKFRVVLTDIDVEAPNDHILLGLEKLGKKEDIRSFFPIIDYKKCTACGACAKVCDTGAIVMAKGKPPMIMPRLCSGCKACIYACPFDAIKPGERVIGELYITDVSTPLGSLKLLTGVLKEGEEHTPPAIVYVKRRALEESRNSDVLVIDTGAGAGNGIAAAIQGSKVLIAVTEPTPLGAHDLRAILKIAKGSGIRTWMVINRADIGPEEELLSLADEFGVERVFRIPYSREVAEAYAKGRLIVVEHPESEPSRVLKKLAEEVSGLIEKELVGVRM